MTLVAVCQSFNERRAVTRAGAPNGLGHGVGLEVHEAPMLGYDSAGRLAARVPVTIEPGVYLPGMGGVRIEDVLVVDGDGTSRASAPEGLLTTTTRELLAL